jgi:hypothetical protein
MYQVKEKIMSADIAWIMDSECCYRCGCILDYFEFDLCTDCLRDAWYNEDQERYDAFMQEYEDLEESKKKTREFFRQKFEERHPGQKSPL